VDSVVIQDIVDSVVIQDSVVHQEPAVLQESQESAVSAATVDLVGTAVNQATAATLAMADFQVILGLMALAERTDFLVIAEQMVPAVTQEKQEHPAIAV
jgi:hypothetical protein